MEAYQRRVTGAQIPFIEDTRRKKKYRITVIKGLTFFSEKKLQRLMIDDKVKMKFIVFHCKFQTVDKSSPEYRELYFFLLKTFMAGDVNGTGEVIISKRKRKRTRLRDCILFPGRPRCVRQDDRGRGRRPQEVRPRAAHLRALLHRCSEF